MNPNQPVDPQMLAMLLAQGNPQLMAQMGGGQQRPPMPRPPMPGMPGMPGMQQF